MDRIASRAAAAIGPTVAGGAGDAAAGENKLPTCSKAIRAEAAGTSLDAEIDDVIAAILISRFSAGTIPEICAMGGITVDEFTSSVVYR